MNNTRFLQICIVVLLLINSVTIGIIWFHRPPAHERGPFNFLTRELKLTETQQEQYKQLRDEHHQSMLEYEKKIGESRGNFFHQLSVTKDSLLVNNLTDSIAQYQKQADLLTFYHFQKVREICNAEQQKKFDEVIQEALQMMRPAPPKR